MKTRTEQKINLFDKEYTEIRDINGKYMGYSEKKENLAGQEYIKHYDLDGNFIGESQLEDGAFYGEYIQHWDANRKKAGTTELRERTFSNDLELIHFNSDKEEVGKSIKEDGVFTSTYTNHDGANSLHARSEQLFSIDKIEKIYNDELIEEPFIDKSVEEPTPIIAKTTEPSPLVIFLFKKLGLGIVIGIILLIITGQFINSMILGLILAFVGQFFLKLIFKDLSNMGK